MKTNKDLIERQAAIEVVKHAWAKGLEPTQYLEALPAVQPQPEEDCDTCKHGYFGDRQCDNCRVRYPSHYEREEEQHEET